MALEAFHHVIKVCYMEKKQNRRIDYLLHLLLKFSRDKVFERLFKTQKGKSSHRLCEINKRHRTAEKMCPADTILSVGDGTWKVKPASLQQTSYFVQRRLDSCTCKLCCSSCNACVHLYSCTCMDFLIHSTVCKHIHLVKIFSEAQSNDRQDNHPCKQLELTSLTMHKNPEKDELPADEYDAECVNTEVADYSPRGSPQEDTNNGETNNGPLIQDDVSSIDYLSSQVNTNPISELNTLKEKMIATCKSIEVALGSTTNMEAVKAAKKHLNVALTIINAKCTDNETLVVHKRAAPNSNSVQQIRFHPTKKKCTQKARISKPSEEELVSCRDELKKVDIKVCGLCLLETDNQHGHVVNWIQCDSCDIWFHQSCTKVNTVTDSYNCNFCVPV